MKIGIDFDGTCVTHEYPRVGRDIGAVPVLKDWAAAGHLLILNTMRSGKELEDAVNWFRTHEIPLYGVNKDPGQEKWTGSPKPYAELYIDDAALGAPLIHDPAISSRPFISWKAARWLMLEPAVSHRTDGKKKRKGRYEKYEEARRAWAEKGGWVRYQILRYLTWRLGRTPVGILQEEAEAAR
jgi:hypothetical protein